jgi:peptidoglycan/LPS O-acetylase OafA/YrhL
MAEFRLTFLMRNAARIRKPQSACNPDSTMLQQQYRPEVDGLRAWAVLAVILYHFNFHVFKGGFVGVDIFFVISGFLITRNIMADIGSGSFSFARFYSRRVKRLFPALYAVFFLSLLFGYLLFTPEHYKGLSVSLLWSVLSTANVLFWQEAGYFDTAAEFKPLLHTWSLAVEEQFYLVWPALLLVLSRLGKKWLLLFLLLSSAVSVWQAERWLASDPSGAFFLTPFRLAEFACGAALVWLPRLPPENNLLLELLLAIAFFCIGWGVFTFSKSTAFPGLHALVPCLGAALAVYGGQARFLGWLLRNPLAVGVGLISYSLYLVHWPLLIFYQYWRYAELSLKERLALLLATFLLAWLSWKFIEQPFRKGRLVPQRMFFFLCAWAAALLLTAGSAVVRENGLPGRISGKFSQVKNAGQFHADQYGGKGYPLTGRFGAKKANRKVYDVLLTGDSFVLQYAAGLDQLFQEHGITAKVAADYSCIIGPDITFLYQGSPDKECSRQNSLFLSLAKASNTPVIFSIGWEFYQENIGDSLGNPISFADKEAYHDFLIANLRRVRAEIGKGRQLIIIGNPPGSGNRNGIISCLNRPAFLPNNCLEGMTYPRVQGLGFAINRKLREFAAAEPDTLFIDPFDAFCGQENCAALDYRLNKIWYSDGWHLSIDGSKKAAEHFGEKLVKAIQERH